MGNESQALLCMFAYDKRNLPIVIDYINYRFDDLNNEMVFVFENSNKRGELYCTFNILSKRNNLPENTIVIHRNSQTNTLYTINALNSIVMNINNGVLDESQNIHWQLYTNKLLIINDGDLERIPIDLKRIYYMNNDNYLNNYKKIS